MLRLLRRPPAPLPDRPAGLPAWAGPLFASTLAPARTSGQGEVLVWGIENDTSQAVISEQFKADAGTYHARYGASDHFEALFRQALDATRLQIAAQPLILDLGSGSGVNSVVPCRRLFPGARAVATDLSGELLEILAGYAREAGFAEDVVPVVMDAMSDHVAPGRFDLVTGASILHHLERPEQGLAAAARALKPGGHAIFFEPFNGWSVMRLAYERILAEAELRRSPLPAEVDRFFRGMVADISARSHLSPDPAQMKAMDDKWLFSRTRIEHGAQAAGFAQVQFVPHNDHGELFHDASLVQLRLSTGADAALPDWARDILRSFDAAFNLHTKRELMLEGSIVLTKGAGAPA